VENPEAKDIIAKIRPLVVTFEPKTTIKRQILADFIAEFTQDLHMGSAWPGMMGFGSSVGR